jgi:hypothetical protein
MADLTKRRVRRISVASPSHVSADTSVSVASVSCVYRHETNATRRTGLTAASLQEHGGRHVE